MAIYCCLYFRISFEKFGFNSTYEMYARIYIGAKSMHLSSFMHFQESYRPMLLKVGAVFKFKISIQLKFTGCACLFIIVCSC